MCIGDIMREVMEELTQKFGYMDIKQSSKVRSRKLRTWRRRWVVFTKMSNLSSDEIVGKLDMYDSEETWKNDPSNRTTFILEHVTAIRQSTSRTHPHAFEIVERQPSIVLSGTTELESYGWLLTLQHIFTPHSVESTKDTYAVRIQDNDDSRKWKLNGEYCLSVAESGVSLLEESSSMNVKIIWGLSTLIRFTMERNPSGKSTDDPSVLVIQCGPNSPTGESTFKFKSDEVKDIIKTIRHYICIALVYKQSVRRNAYRVRSVSATCSEKNFLHLLDTQPVFQDHFKDRSGSDSSGSTLPPNSPSSGNVPVPDCVVVRSESALRIPARKSTSELGVVDEVEEHTSTGKAIPFATADVRGSDCKLEDSGHQDFPDSRVPTSIGDSGYSVIKDVARKAKSLETKGSLTFYLPKEGDISNGKISAEVCEELVLPSSSTKIFQQFSPDNHNLDCHDSDEHSPSISDEHCSSTQSLERRSKLNGVDPIYQDVDQVAKDDSIAHEYKAHSLNRRRSSSTPDLQAFWKKHGFESSFENVYEELDEHRRSFFRSSKPKAKTKEVPPALPARPLISNFSTAPKDSENQPVLRFKKSFEKKSNSKKMKSSSPDPTAIGNKANSCKCQTPRPRKRSNNSKRQTCHACGGKIKSTDIFQSNQSRVEDTPIICGDDQSNYAEIKPRHKFATFLSSSAKPFNPRKQEVADDSIKTFQNFMDASSHFSGENAIDISKRGNCAEENSTHELASSLPLCTNGIGSLIDLDDDETCLSSLRRSSKNDIRVIRPCSKNDPLIGFFMDDDKFDTNPLVTGRHVGRSNFDVLSALSNEQPSVGEVNNQSKVGPSSLQLPLTKDIVSPPLPSRCPLTPAHENLGKNPPQKDGTVNESLDGFLLGPWTFPTTPSQLSSPSSENAPSAVFGSSLSFPSDESKSKQSMTVRPNAAFGMNHDLLTVRSNPDGTMTPSPNVFGNNKDVFPFATKDNPTGQFNFVNTASNDLFPLSPVISSSNNDPFSDDSYMTMSTSSKQFNAPLNSITATQNSNQSFGNISHDPFIRVRHEDNNLWQAFDINDNFPECIDNEANNDEIYVRPGRVTSP